MRTIAIYAVCLLAGAAAMRIATLTTAQSTAGQSVAAPQTRPTPQAPMPPGPNPNSQYRLGPDSLPQDGVPRGVIRGPFTLPSNAYPGTQHTYWIYEPAQYDPAI